MAVGRIVLVAGETSRFLIQQIKSASPSRYPDIPLLVFHHIQYRIRPDAVIVERTVPVVLKKMPVPQEQIQAPAIRPNPYIPPAILAERFYITVTKTIASRFRPVKVEFPLTGAIDVNPPPVGANP